MKFLVGGELTLPTHNGQSIDAIADIRVLGETRDRRTTSISKEYSLNALAPLQHGGRAMLARGERSRLADYASNVL
jgi:predicted ribonuclease YlaK